jgi:hypothetical protein
MDTRSHLVREDCLDFRNLVQAEDVDARFSHNFMATMKRGMPIEDSPRFKLLT